MATKLLEERRTPSAKAEIQAETLVEAELKGHPSHGLQRLPRILTRIERGLIDPRTEGYASWRSPSFLEVDGLKGLGPVVATSALRQLTNKARSSGIAVCGIRNSNHLGMLAHYVESIAAHGQIGLALSSSEALVHPHGGTRAVLGTNPLAIAVPTAGRPMVVDLATGIVSMGKIHHHAANGMSIPLGWARDEFGQPTTDARQAKKGAIAPFGDAKGYALGMALELMVAALAGSALSPDVRGTLDAAAICNKGDVFIAIDIGSQPDLLLRLSSFLDLVRASIPADPTVPVTVPGDRSAARRRDVLLNGFEIAPRLWQELIDLSYSSDALSKGHAR
ncbi:LDH2 family malate/lactate/ureidoglycolate dehydrogenase [Pararhizobium capsulatum DSM 1112]|uniref:LDH2 family malate/lactate/ureidoglycolate dehydrogenase n=1 Tax=Pararhizobium capsulatum DSM 1112 TaxID=1121113 RepID=A0ABU0BYI3_9HYPH|nr:LDH2 family malate/lactate/ureidoglycolate dehydrogenase [Pararhizobium capsulatum DSM 1112]